MKCIKKRIYAIMSAAAVSSALAVSLSSSANTVVRDANGDGLIRMNDAVITTQYLMGKYNPTNVKSFDFDGNNVISAMDSMKIQQYLLGNIGATGLPSPSTEVTNAGSIMRRYRKHDCLDTDHTSQTIYSLTVDPLDNTSASYSSPRTVFPPNNMVPDSDTAVVRLTREGDPDGNGTGFIVGDHVIATAAHCVYKNGNFYNMNIEIVDSNNTVIDEFESRYIHIPDLYTYNPPNAAYDYALIYVEENLSEYGKFNMGVALDEYTENEGSVVVSGFTNEYPPNYTGPTGEIRFMSAGNLCESNSSDLSNYKLFYDSDTAEGTSGGPVYVNEAFYANNTWYNSKTVIAIHTNGSAYYEFNNCGTKITPYILKFYNDNSNIN